MNKVMFHVMRLYQSIVMLSIYGIRNQTINFRNWYQSSRFISNHIVVVEKIGLFGGAV
jgi:hypothetical protein